MLVNLNLHLFFIIYMCCIFIIFDINHNNNFRTIIIMLSSLYTNISVHYVIEVRENIHVFFIDKNIKDILKVNIYTNMFNVVITRIYLTQEY